MYEEVLNGSASREEAVIYVAVAVERSFIILVSISVLPTASSFKNSYEKLCRKSHKNAFVVERQF